jgi:hypothetical protein
MLGKIVVRTVGALLMVWSAYALSRLAAPEVRDALQSLPAVLVRYAGLFASGLGFVLLRKWGLFLYLAVIALQWLLYFTLYNGQGAAGPLWLGLLGPLLVIGLAALNWKHLR